MNAFLDAAERQIVSPVKARARAVESRRATMSDRAREAEKKLEEKDILLGLFKRWRRSEFKALLAGPHGKDVRGLMSFMRAMTLSSAPALVTFMERAKWVSGLNKHDRGLVEDLIFQAIAKLREKNGLSFWEDPLPGQPPKAFCLIKDMLR